jgi:hypothetical protein
VSRLFASTFIAGAASVVGEALKKTLPKVIIQRLDDGLALYRTSGTPDAVKRLRFVQNTFQVLSYAPELDASDPLKSLVTHVRNDDALGAAMASAGRLRKYKLQASIENALTKLHPIQRQKFERLMGEYGLEPAGQKPDCELWLLTRREGYGFFGLRLTRHEQYNHALQPGELKPDVAHLLCLLSDPKPTDVFLDPLAGSGAIAWERAKAFPYAKMFVGDSDPKHGKDLAKKAAALRNVTVGSWDARTLHGIDDASVDAIVTDPPWGKFQNDLDLLSLYRGILQSFARVLKAQGKAVILTSREGPFEECLKANASLVPVAHHDILVNGQKARVWILRKA